MPKKTPELGTTRVQIPGRKRLSNLLLALESNQHQQAWLLRPIIDRLIPGQRQSTLLIASVIFESIQQYRGLLDPAYGLPTFDIARPELIKRLIGVFTANRPEAAADVQTLIDGMFQDISHSAA